MRNVFLFLMMLVGIGVAHADIATYTVTPNGGLFSYDFTLANAGDTGGTLYDLFLSIPLDISAFDTTSIGAPVGWGDPTGGLLFFGPDVGPGTSFVEWADDISGLYDLAIGNSLSGFSFVSSQEVASPITFALNGSTSFATADQVSTVPEPSSLSSLCLVCVGLVWLAKCRMNRRALSDGGPDGGPARRSLSYY